MAGICFCSPLPPAPTIYPKMVYGIRCSSNSPEHSGGRRNKEAPKIVKIVVSGVTELLRLFSSPNGNRSDGARDNQGEELVIAGADDVLTILKSDYENAYFVTDCYLQRTTVIIAALSRNEVSYLWPIYNKILFELETGIFTSSIYADDCLFEDPTIRFRGKDLYSRNLNLLVPFFDCPSIQLRDISKGNRSGVEFVLAAWKLRTYLRLPWRPLISIDGSTLYELDEEFKITRHAENWSISASEAIGQIFTPNFGGK